MPTLTRDRTPKLTDDVEYEPTRLAMVEAEEKLRALEERWAAVQRLKDSHDLVARVEARDAERELELAIPRARANAEQKRRAYEAIRMRAQTPITQWHRERISTFARSISEAVENLDARLAEMRMLIEAARSDDVLGMPLGDLLLADALSNDSPIRRCLGNLRRHGWLA
jgi:hypothetical protein